MRRTLIVPLLIGALAGTPAAAFASVRITSVTSPVYAGSYATVTARVLRVLPSRVVCSITVRDKNGPSHARGLHSKSPVNGRARWTWKVDARTTPGRRRVFVSCGRAGSASTSFRVVRR